MSSSPAPIGKVEAEFGAKAGQATPASGSTKASKAKNEDEHARADRLHGKKTKAAAIRAATEGKPGEVSEESQTGNPPSPPLLFDLTSLQREANARFGFLARPLCSIAQALYEKHKVLTYPRTDSRALPEDYLSTVKATVDAHRRRRRQRIRRRVARPIFALRPPSSRNQVLPNKRIFNNAKVAITLPLSHPQAPKHLEQGRIRLYDFVVRRFLSVFFPAAEYLVTTRGHPGRQPPLQDRRQRVSSHPAGSPSMAGRPGRRRRQSGLKVEAAKGAHR